MIVRFWKLILAWIIAKPPQPSRPGKASQPINTSVVDIGKQDLIDALDGQIAVLNERRKYYQKQTDECYKPEDKLKLMDKVARLEVQIAQKEVKVLKLREEIDK